MFKPYPLPYASLINSLNEDDLLILTADHGNDPTWTGSDHTRENVPFVLYSKSLNEGQYLGEYDTFGVIGSTVADNFNIEISSLLGDSVLENLKLGAYTRKDKNEMEETLKMIYKRFPRLEERKNQIAGTLSGGEQQMLAMGRALMSHPKIILMDEPSMGLSPIFVEEVFKIIRDISAEGVTVLLVEQNAKKALNIADRAYVLETGNIILQGDAKKLMNDESVKKAYLGE